MDVPDYRIELWDIDGEKVLDISHLVTPEIELKLNDADVVTFKLDLKQFTDLCDSVNILPRNVLYPAKSNIVIWRNGLILTAGEVSIADTEKDGNGNKTLNITVDGWLNYFANRFIKKDYVDTERSEIAWDAIDTAQSVTNGDYGVVLGDTATTFNSDLTADYKDVKSIIQRYTYARPTTYDFDILTEIQDRTIVKVFNTYLRKGSDKPHINLVDPFNCNFNRIRRSSDTLANRVIGLGSGIGEERVESVQEDTDSQLNYLVREKKQTFNSVVEEETLDNNIEGILENSKGVLVLFDAEPYPGTIDLGTTIVGDSLTCTMENDPYNDDVAGVFRIYNIKISLDINRSENVTLSFYNPSAGGELEEEEIVV